MFQPGRIPSAIKLPVAAPRIPSLIPYIGGIAWTPPCCGSRSIPSIAPRCLEQQSVCFCFFGIGSERERERERERKNEPLNCMFKWANYILTCSGYDGYVHVYSHYSSHILLANPSCLGQLFSKSLRMSLSSMDAGKVELGLACAWYGPEGTMISNEDVRKLCEETWWHMRWNMLSRWCIMILTYSRNTEHCMTHQKDFAAWRCMKTWDSHYLSAKDSHRN